MINNVILKGLAFVSNTIASLREERGQDLIEYAVLAGAIALVAAVALYITGPVLSFTNFKSAIQNCVNMDPSSCGT